MAEINTTGHERSDASARGVMRVVVGLVIAAVVIHGGVLGFEYALAKWYQSPVESTRLAEPREHVPPPQLQRFPELDWEQYRASEQALLQGYGWVDRRAGIIRIPIERAMDLTLERGLPARPVATPAPVQKGGAK